MWIWKYVTVLFFGSIIGNANADNECTTPNGEGAVCQSASKCQPFVISYSKANEEQIRFWQESKCGTEEDQFVCCGTLDNYWPSNSHIPGRNECALQENVKYNETGLDGYPWIAQLQYKSTSSFFCIGFLISSRFILTAASCVRSSVGYPYRTLEKVRLGKWNNETNLSCISENNSTLCNSLHEEIDIESITFHGQYTGKVEDEYNIALIKLNKEVKYTNNIRPICLPERNEKINVGDNLYFIGLEENRMRRFKVRATESGRCINGISILSLDKSENWTCAENPDLHNFKKGLGVGLIMKTSQSNTTEWYLGGMVISRLVIAKYIDGSNFQGMYINVASHLYWIYANAVN